MRFNLLLLVLLVSVPLAAQEALSPGTIDTVTIPGAEVSFPVVYLPGGTVTLEVDGQVFTQGIEAKLEAFCLQVERLHTKTREEKSTVSAGR